MESLTGSITYKTLEFSCPYCGIKITFAYLNKISSKRTRCPKCLKEIEIRNNKVYKTKEKFNPSKRY